ELLGFEQVAELACFVNLARENNPLSACLEMVDVFYELLSQYPSLSQVKSPADLKALPSLGKIGAMLTVEEGGVCLGKEEILRDLYRLGVRMMTLTWNHENELAYPNNVPGSIHNLWPSKPETEKGLKEAGFAFVAEMERLHMIVDVSHLSDKGIWDVLSVAKRPFAASHSSARSLCRHPRNLPDEMIRAMAEAGCLIGVNYCPSFLTEENPPISRIRDIVRHARHIINVGGEDILALGSDFDGITGELELKDASCMPLLAEAFLQEGFTPREIEKIFYRNALRFFIENL
ncbi:MAG: dipeptidase, partial [Blautia sp.]|nr:dipeptidase [Blautia sp.]